MVLHIEAFAGFRSIFGFESNGGLEAIKEAVQGLPLHEGQMYRIGSGCMLFKKEGTLVRTYKLRENSNGWHDLAVYRLPEWESIGKHISANPSAGQHRDVVVL